MKQVYSITILNAILSPAGAAPVTISWKGINDVNYNLVGTFMTDVAGYFNPPIVIIVPSAGQYIVKAESCGCEFTKIFFAATTNVPVIPKTPGIIYGDANVCPHENVTYFIDPVKDATSYTWSVPAGWTILAGQGTTMITAEAGNAAQNGAVTVIANGPDGSSPVSQINVGVGDVPATPGAITGATPQTPNTSGQVYQITPVPGATSYIWTFPAGWTIDAGAGTESVTVTTGTTGGSITVVAVGDCGNSQASILAVTVVVPANWVENLSHCEQDGIFILENEYDDYSSPILLYFEPVQGLIYAVDYDDPAGNVYKVDPDDAAFTSKLPVAAGVIDDIYCGAVDPVNGRIFVAGKNTSGAKVIKMGATDTFDTPLSYGAGSNGQPFNRLAIDITSTQIICNDQKAGTLARFHRAGLGKIEEIVIGGMDYPDDWNGAYKLDEIHGQLWLTGGIRLSGSNGRIAIYNFTDVAGSLAYDSQIATGAVIPSWDSVYQRYWQDRYYDAAKDNFYLGDCGSSTLKVYNATTKAIKATIVFTNRGNPITYPTALLSFTVDPVTQDLYVVYQGLNSDSMPTAARDSRVYKINRDTFVLEQLLPDRHFLSLILDSDGKLWGCNSGTPKWSLDPGWQTDGQLLQFSR